MESDDDYESFSFHNNEPSPSPKHRRLKRLKKSTTEADRSEKVESVSELLDLPVVDFGKSDALESSDIRAFDDSSEPLDFEASEGFDDELVNLDRTEEGFDDDKGKEKELSSCYDDKHVNSDPKEIRANLDFEEGDGDDDVVETKLRSDSGDSHVKSIRKETKRALEFDDDDYVVDKRVEKESETVNMEIREDVKKGVEASEMNEKKGKKKRLKSSIEDPKAKTTNKRREAKERKAYLDQLHAESQRLLRETRGVSFKPVPLVQKPISSVLERIRQRKLEVLKKFSQSISNNVVEEDDDCLKQDSVDHSKSIDTEDGELSESVKEEKVDHQLNDIVMDVPDVGGEQKIHENACSEKASDEESTPVLRAPVNDTEDLFGDTQTSDSKASDNEESCEHSQEEEMGPSLLAMKLKFDSAPDDISDEEEEENDKENIAPKGDPVKAFVDIEAEEEDDSDNDQMRFGDDEEENEYYSDTEELNKMIATDYKERPIDLETRKELHQKWLEEKDAAGTDEILRKYHVISNLKNASLLEEDDAEMNDDDVIINDNDESNDEVEENVEKKPRVARIDAKKTKELIAQMFIDKDEEYVSDDEETEKILVKERLTNKSKEKSTLVSPFEDENSREAFSIMKKLNTVPDARKKSKITSLFDTMLTGGNNSSSPKSSFLSRASTNSVPTSSKQRGTSGARSFIFGRDDSNSRSSFSVSEDTSDTTTTTTRETERKKVTTTKYFSSQSQATQNTKAVTEESSSLFEILKRSSVQPKIDNNQNNKIEINESLFAAFKISKKPVRVQGRV